VDAPLVPIPEATEDELIELLENNEAVASAHLFLMQVGEAAAPQLKIGIWSNGSGAQWLPQQYARLLRQKQLSFEPFDVPEMVILNEIPGGENLRDNLPPFYQSDEDAAAQAGQGNVEDAEDLDEESEDLDEAEDFSEEAGDEGEETGERGEESHDAEAPPADAPPRRRGFWPFGKK